MPRQFLRQDTHRLRRLGSNRRKLRKWRKPTGKHSKIRRMRTGYPAAPAIGYKSPRSEVHKLNGLYPKLVSNLNDLNKLTKENSAILSRTLGAKKKLEIIKKAEEMKIKITNLGGKK